MATTHLLFGMALGTALVGVAPDLAPAAVVGGAVGGLLPDLDLVADHRRTLHFPVYYWLVAVPAVGFAAVAPGPVTVGLAVAALAAAVHSVADAAGGGLELRPWEGRSNRAVYCHATGRWIAPRRWVRYDGAPEDLALAAALAVPTVVAFDGGLRTVALGAVAVSAVYALVRRRVPDWTPERFR